MSHTPGAGGTVSYDGETNTGVPFQESRRDVPGQHARGWLGPWRQQTVRCDQQLV